MIQKEEINQTLRKYDKKKVTIATIGSHSALQILKGAKDEGFKTIVISRKDQAIVYDQFNVGDEKIVIDDYKDILDEKIQEKLIDKNVILIPHGSFVEYVGAKNIEDKIKIPMFGNRLVLKWESNRDKQRDWLIKAGIKMPKKFSSPEEIDRLVMVKFPGAKGGKGYFLAKNKKEFNAKMKKHERKGEEYSIQEYVIGTLMYPHYFHSPLESRTEMLSMDIRYESNIDGLTRIPSAIVSGYKVDPSYVVTGNIPIVARESLLPQVLEMGMNVVETSKKLFPLGLVGPFCIESVCTKDLEITVFEISARIVAGTNLYINGSPYSQILYKEPMSTGRRIAREIKSALKRGRIEDIVY
ncbi:MAG: formate--phosphoribosylaminoimidazolecarboxamide ligase [Candidatus Altiarchaeales archaeon]|nr:formate--phosphoribosylaminoimidazolecarboxamide ligase [Candidatus Altiarchaeales archaeon]